MNGLRRAWAASFALAMLGWVFFRADTIAQAGHYIARLFVSISVQPLAIDVSARAWAAIALAAVTAFMPESWWDRLGWTSALPATRVQVAGRILVGTALFLLACAALANQSYNPFIYFRF